MSRTRCGIPGFRFAHPGYNALTGGLAAPITWRSVGRAAARIESRKAVREESPGSMDMRCRITSGGRKPRESATENRPPCPCAGAARVKRCGKSAPRLRQRRRHGKPHREQDRIGTARVSSRKRGNPDRVSAIGRPGRLLEAPGNRRPRGMVVTRRRISAPYRTRLTGRLMH